MDRVINVSVSFHPSLTHFHLYYFLPSHPPLPHVYFLPSFSLQAQARFNESSQKLDLLRYSLEQRLSELPKNHPRSSSIVEELSLLSSPVLSPRSSIISTQNQYSTVTKPAALTGKDIATMLTCTLIFQIWQYSEFDSGRVNSILCLDILDYALLRV